MTQDPVFTAQPGQWVRHPGRPDWGVGQVQSAIGERVTVNFENAGKVLVNTCHLTLDIVELPEGMPEGMPEAMPAADGATPRRAAPRKPPPAAADRG